MCVCFEGERKNEERDGGDVENGRGIWKIKKSYLLFRIVINVYNLPVVEIIS